MNSFMNVFILFGLGLGMLSLTGCVSPGANKIVDMSPKYEKLMRNSDDTLGLNRAWVDEAGIKKYDKIVVDVVI
jgi:hypothetical protein